METHENCRQSATVELSFDHAGRRIGIAVAAGLATVSIEPGFDESAVQVITGIWNGRRLRGLPELGRGMRVRIAMSLIQATGDGPSFIVH